MNSELYASQQEYLAGLGIFRNFNVVLEGDSLTATGSGYGEYIALDLDGCNTLTNMATGGDAMFTGILSEGHVIDRYFNSGFVHNIAVLLSRNDVGGDYYTSQQIADAFNVWGLSRKLAGFMTIIITLPVSNDATWNTKREEINGLIIASHTGFDAVCDLGADEIYGDMSYVGDPIWFIDNIHHTVAGRQRVAGIVSPEIETLGT